MGVNNIPPKVCTYSCVYCQVGRTLEMRAERRAFYEPGSVFRLVREQVAKAAQVGERIDYLTFVPDGEPTLDIHLGREIDLLRPLGIHIAVITNASLIGREDVREELGRADWVSLKMDAVREDRWRRMDRPHGLLRLNGILEGAIEFAPRFRGRLVTETMLVQGVNDDEDAIRELAEFLARLKPATAYLAVPTRPPAEPWVSPPCEAVLNRAYHILAETLPQVEYLIGYEGNAFAATGEPETDLLSITAVHPMREDAVRHFLMQAGAGWQVMDRLLAQGQLAQTTFGGHSFYVRKLGKPGPPPCEPQVQVNQSR
jgi:wyosine [tRNA(Phe)-imidazoG37] synthetase (radical SAM superfamily)